jgi:hypothetical protein
MNFILVHFKTEYGLARLNDYYKDVDLFHNLIIKQIDKLYKDEGYKIHVLTNVDIPSSNKVIYHYSDTLEPSNYAKLRIFGLLNEPAMYLDNDIILLKKFEEKHLVTDNAFNLFQEYDVALPKGMPSWMLEYPHYNSGIVWIPRPNEEITKALFNIVKYFPVFESGWGVDEFPIAYFIEAFGLKMQTFKEVNAYRKSTKLPLKECQTIHYAGVKELFLEELKKLSLENNI